MAQAVLAHTQSTFFAQLLAPIASHGADRRFLAELRREAEQAWSIALHRYHAAHAFREHCAHVRRVAEIERRSLRVPEAAQEQQAHLALVSTVDRMMHVPAPTIGAIRQKQKLRELDGGRDRWEIAIAADLVRLGGNR